MTQLRGQERAQLLPTKEALTALKSDVTLESAILELCDNALDAWKRTNDQRGSARIDIDVDTTGEQPTLIIRDDTGGVPRDEAAMLFGLGRTAKQNNGSIGTFGVGAKKSLVNLGIPFTIRSRHASAAEGWRFRIDEAWFEDDEDWSVPLHSDSELAPGITEIKIEEEIADYIKLKKKGLEYFEIEHKQNNTKGEKKEQIKYPCPLWPGSWTTPGTPHRSRSGSSRARRRCRKHPARCRPRSPSPGVHGE